MYVPCESKIHIYSVEDCDLTLLTKLDVPTQRPYSGSNIQYPSVSLTASDLDGDYTEELTFAASTTTNCIYTEQDVRCVSCMRIFDFSSGFETPTMIYENFLENNNCNMIGVNVDSGDINGDGAEELVVAGYPAGFDMWGVFGAELNFDCYLYTWLKMDENGNMVSGTNDIFYAVERPSGDFFGALFDNNFVYDNNYKAYWKTYNQYIPPIPLQAVKTMGDGYPSQILIGCALYGWNPNGDLYKKSPSGIYKTNEIQQQAFKGCMDRYVILEPRINEHLNNNKSKVSAAEVWMESVVAANFNGNAYGQEQLLYSLNIKSTAGDYYWIDIGALAKKNAGDNSYANRSDYYQLQEKVFSGSETRNAVSATKENGPYVSLAAVDNDDDGILARPVSRSISYTKPTVMAVLQGAPYFKDLDSLNGDYTNAGATSFGKSTSGEVGATAGGSIIATWAMEFEQNLGAFGLDAAQVQAGVNMTTKVTTEINTSFSKTKGIEYTTNSDQDSAVVFAVPRITYQYEVWVPVSIIPTVGPRYDAWIEERLAAHYPESGNEGECWSDFDEEQKNKLRTQYKKMAQPGEKTGGYWEPMSFNVDLTPVTSVISVETYDAIAAETEGMEPIRGNILKNINGEPTTYNQKPEFLLGDNYQAASVGSASTTISGENSTQVDTAIGLEFELVTTRGGGAFGFSVINGLGFSVNTGITAGICNAKNFSGSVANLPNGADEYGYGFNWNFGYSMLTLNNNKIPVLMYHVTNAMQPPSLPVNIDVFSATQDSVNLQWEPGYRPAFSYTVFDYDPYTGRNRWLANVPSRIQSFEDTGLTPNTAYTYRIQATSAGMRSVYSQPLSTRTQPDSGTAAFSRQPKDVSVYSGGSASFNVRVSGVSAFTSAAMYQWEKNDGNGWTEIYGANTSTYKIGTVKKAEHDGVKYRCRAYARVAGDMVEIISDPATLTMDKATVSLSFAASKGTSSLKDGDSITSDYYEYEPIKTAVKGDVIKLSAAVNETQTAIPSGNVAFRISCNSNSAYNESIIVPLSGNNTTAEWTAPGEGTFSISAEYLGDSLFKSGASTTLALDAFEPNSTTSLLCLESTNMTYGESSDFKAYLTSPDGKQTVSDNITYTVTDKNGEIVDSALMSKSNTASAVIDRFTPDKAGDYTVTAVYDDGTKSLSAVSFFKVRRAVLTVQAPNITRYLEESREIATDELILTGLKNPNDVSKDSFHLTSIYDYDSDGNIIPVPTEAGVGKYGSYPLVVESDEDILDRYSIVTQNGLYTIAQPALTLLPTIGNYADWLEVEVETGNVLVVYVRSKDDTSVDLNKIRLYKAEYDLAGKLVSIKAGVPAIDDDGNLSFTMEIPNEDCCKLFLWDEAIRPIINPMKAVKAGTSDNDYIWSID